MSKERYKIEAKNGELKQRHGYNVHTRCYRYSQFENRDMQECTIGTIFGSVTIKKRRYVDRDIVSLRFPLQIKLFPTTKKAFLSNR